jgi:thiamine-phosphate pyrophosphorylase
VKGLYVITAEVPHLGRTHLDVARAAVSGGARVIQVREKNKVRDALSIAREIRRLTRGTGVKFVVNDRVDIAQAADADGVHLGQGDTEISEARRMLGDDKIIGVSATCLDEAVEAEALGADYVGVGPIFPTPSKTDAAEPIGCRALREIRKRVRLPLVAIGGITIENLEEVLASGADSVAVISAVANASDMEAAVRDLVEKISIIAKSIERRA